MYDEVIVHTVDLVRIGEENVYPPHQAVSHDE